MVLATLMGTVSVVEIICVDVSDAEVEGRGVLANDFAFLHVTMFVKSFIRLINPVFIQNTRVIVSLALKLPMSPHPSTSASCL